MSRLKSRVSKFIDNICEDIFLQYSRIMFGNNHLFVLHHPKDKELLKKKEEAKEGGKEYEDTPPSFEQAQEEIAQNSGLLNYGDVTKKDGKDGKKSKGTLNFFKLLLLLYFEQLLIKLVEHAQLLPPTLE